MRLAYVAHHVPDPEGTAAGRQLWAVCSALVEAGHEVTVRSWRPEPPTSPLPEWCRWHPLPDAPMWRRRARSVLQPRSDVLRGGPVDAPDDAVVVADDPFSWAAVAGQGRLGVVTVHFSVALDRGALGWTAAALQDLRGERRAVRQAGAVWALSDRVQRSVGGVTVPPSVPLPAAVPDPVEEPVVGLLADWSWRPNVVAAQVLVEAWPQVRDAVPGARLVLAGRGSSPVGALAGVEWLGEVRSAADLLSRTAVFAFPCPPTSGPKMKVMDAFAHGVAVLTTPAGVEGLVGGQAAAAVARDDEALVPALVELLRDPARRAALAAAGRRVVVEHHAPAVAARARVAALEGSSV